MLASFIKALRGKQSSAPPTDFLSAGHSGSTAGAEVTNLAPGYLPSSEELVLKLQHDRNSHVIGLIHRHQSDRESFEAWFFDAMIGEHHLQDFMTAMQSVPEDARLDIVLHSIGGFSLEVQQIARAIKAHKGETTVFIPHYAHSFSTLIAIAADKIVMGPAASMSYIEPSDHGLSEVVRQKGVRKVQDQTLMRLTMANNFGRELRALVTELAPGNSGARIAAALTGGKRSPWDPLTVSLALKMGLPVSTNMPPGIFSLIQANRAMPTSDHGVKTAGRMMSAQRASAMTAHDLELCLSHGFNMPRPEDRHTLQAPPLARGHDDAGNEDDPHGVSLENCDITIRPLISKMEAARGSRVICIIHQAGMESHSVDTVTTEDILTALQSTPPGTPLDIILQTPGGFAYQAHQIALALKAHRGRKTVFVPYFAMSGGTIIALAADEIIMSPHACLGPIDGQFPVYHLHRMMPTRAVLSLLETKPKRRIHDELLELGNLCKRGIVQDHKNALDLMHGTYSPAAANRIAHTLNDGGLTHGYPVTLSNAKNLGLNVSAAMPAEAVAIVRAYRRNRFGKRSVIFCG